MTSRFAALYLVAVVSLAPPALGQTRPAPTGPQPLPRSVFLGNMDQEFLKMDADKNGQVTREEAAAFNRAAAVAGAAGRNNALFRELDADHNGSISPVEFRRLISPPPAAINGQNFINSMDSNRDGKVSLIEHRAATVANFDKIDTDKDGVVTPAEMKAAGIGSR